MSTILQITNTDRSLSVLSEGLKAANLEETLNEKGPFTMLAPVNLAFSQFAPTGLKELMGPLNVSKLAELLSGHILAGKKMYRDFTNGEKVKTINGKEMNVTIKDGEVRINGVKILARDKQGSNGVVHSVDAISLS